MARILNEAAIKFLEERRMLILYWICGFFVSLVVGSTAAGLASLVLCRIFEVEPIPGRVWWRPVLIGLTERFFFTALIAIGGAPMLPSVLPSMIGWLGLKLAASWNHGTRNSATEVEAEHVRRRAFVALSLGLISNFFAFIGGMICLWR